MLDEYIEGAKDIVQWMADNAVLLSVAATLLLFFLSKKKENGLKIYETKKSEYMKLIGLFEKLFSGVKDKKDIAKSMSQKEFYNVGSSLAIFGSKKLYKTYCLYRELAVNENWQKVKYYDKDMLIFLWGEMYQIMRKEIGLNTATQYVDVPDIMFFILNDITKPEYRKKYYQFKYRKMVFKILIFAAKIDEDLPTVWLWNCIIKPPIFVIYSIIHMCIKKVIVNPVRFVIRKIRKKPIELEEGNEL